MTNTIPPRQRKSVEPLTLSIPAIPIPSANGKSSLPDAAQMALWTPASLRDLFYWIAKQQGSDMSTVNLVLCIAWMEQCNPKMFNDWFDSQPAKELKLWLGEAYYNYLLERRLSNG